MTPIQIECLLHYHCRVDDWHNGKYSRSGEDAITFLLHNGMLTFANFRVETLPDGKIKARYKLMLKGRAYVEALQRVPLPEQSWVVPAQEEWTYAP